MLKLAGYLNIGIAIAHLIGLFWLEKVFRIFGIEEKMKELSQIHFSFPYVATLLVAMVFFVFGLYGLSASSTFKKLPFLKFGIFLIAGIYLLRGISELVYSILNNFFPTMGIFATLIGILYFLGGLKKWKVKKK
ncbi:hypothetical protein ATE84_2486 [Aquimarina sp. MAR_2010_214]|uniref:hypothetical protein n=1 Tax=Aquimarina sp. MAR_2010_214 TaxID=1250026 RepID=UPI000C70C422|nr:hypothetical protein [Aquimarina sp. MAR_2010_214]PKV50429.1 hypothetical protein ATE84_2486 [Aquimarina sp. MAR_2010_214]